MPEGVEECRQRRSREELREFLIGAGRAILEEEGLSVGAGELTFKRAFDHVEATTGIRLTNASVIRRVWENQEASRRTCSLSELAQVGAGRPASGPDSTPATGPCGWACGCWP